MHKHVLVLFLNTFFSIYSMPDIVLGARDLIISKSEMISVLELTYWEAG